MAGPLYEFREGRYMSVDEFMECMDISFHTFDKVMQAAQRSAAETAGHTSD